jgi:hypothetical protein
MVFKPVSKRIYASCGGDGGSVDVYREQDSHHYQLLGKVPSTPGASTAHLVTECSKLQFVRSSTTFLTKWPTYKHMTDSRKAFRLSSTCRIRRLICSIIS